MIPSDLMTFAAIISLLLAGLVQFSGITPVTHPAETNVLERPYHLTRTETERFLEIHGERPEVRSYLSDPASTPWGIIVEDYGVGDYRREFLLYEDTRGSVHVIEVTGQAVADAVRKSPYQSPRFDVIGL